MKPDPSMRAEHARAVALFEAMDRLHRQWGRFAPPSPMKKSDVALLGVLTQLEREGESPVTVGRLAKVLRQTPPAISQKLSELHKLGYVTRRTDKADRRLSYIALTDKGREVTKRALETLMGRIEEALDRIGDDVGMLAGLMQKLCDAIEDVATEHAADDNEGETDA